jgi:hypothetical protein
MVLLVGQVPRRAAGGKRARRWTTVNSSAASPVGHRDQRSSTDSADCEPRVSHCAYGSAWTRGRIAAARCYRTERGNIHD